jgi:mono/diheme cytochrome c family protein
LFAVTGAVSLGLAAAQQPTAVFTAAQAQSGRGVYDQNCSGCHGANFEGSGDAPSLSGGTFMLKWGTKMVSELFGVILQTMPPTNPGSLSEAAALNATSYILQRNGAQPGQQSLTGSASTLISAIA